MQADVAALPDDDWVPHFNTSYYRGDWSGVALRSVGGVARAALPRPEPGRHMGGHRDPRATALRSRPRSRRSSARRPPSGCCGSAPGASVREHTDYNLGYDDGEVRFHVPVQTNPDAVFELEGRPIEMQPGESWYVDFNLRHRVANDGDEPRIHLVIDCVVNDWVTRTLAAGDPG